MVFICTNALGTNLRMLIYYFLLVAVLRSARAMTKVDVRARTSIMSGGQLLGSCFVLGSNLQTQN